MKIEPQFLAKMKKEWLLLNKKIITWLRGNVSSSGILAQVNGSLIAIFVGLFSAYYLFLFTTINSIEFQIFKDVNSFLLVKPNFLFYAEDAEELKLFDYKFQFDHVQIQEDLFCLEGVEGCNKFGKEPIMRGKKAVLTINKIFVHYPYNDGAHSGPDDTIKFLAKTPNIVMKKRPRIFKDMRELELQVTKAKEILDIFFDLYNEPNSQLREDISAFINSKKDNGYYNGKWQRFINSLKLKLNTAESLELQFDNLHVFLKQNLSKPAIIIYIILAFITFITSVFLPMIRSTLPVYIGFGIPLIFYVVSFALIIVQVARL